MDIRLVILLLILIPIIVAGGRLHDVAGARGAVPRRAPGRDRHGEPADRGRRLPRALRRPKGIELWAARAGPVRGRVLHHCQDGLHAGLNRPGW